MKYLLKYSVLLILLFISYPLFSCTSVIISSKVTLSGKPLMMKHRDTGELDNRIEYFKGPIYSFIGLVNSSSDGGEIWTGTNSVGFSIMNTASYNIKDDDIPSERMDKEGELMFRALGVCETLSDFEKFLDNISKPYGVEANFGVIDAFGGASYYEINNYEWIKYDVNEIECGYRVVTNFSESGRLEDYKGYERFLTASEIMNELSSNSKEDGKIDIGPHDLFYNISRSYKNSFIGIDYLNDFYSLKSDFGFSGLVPDQDFIPRNSTSASIVIEGVKPGDNPLHTVMWTVLGYPSCSVSFPLMVLDEDCIPSFLKSSEESDNSFLCDFALKVRNETIYKEGISNRSQYIDINSIINLIHSCLAVESFLENTFQSDYELWVNGDLNLLDFKIKYFKTCNDYFNRYLEEFSSFIK